jgi:hypothetical protein
MHLVREEFAVGDSASTFSTIDFTPSTAGTSIAGCEKLGFFLMSYEIVCLGIAAGSQIENEFVLPRDTTTLQGICECAGR